MSAAGVARIDIGETVITHAHDDHAGNIRELPGTRFHLKECEMADATGKDVRRLTFQE